MLLILIFFVTVGTVVWEAAASVYRPSFLLEWAAQHILTPCFIYLGQRMADFGGIFEFFRHYLQDLVLAVVRLGWAGATFISTPLHLAQAYCEAMGSYSPATVLLTWIWWTLILAIILYVALTYFTTFQQHPSERVCTFFMLLVLSVFIRLTIDWFSLGSNSRLDDTNIFYNAKSFVGKF